MQELSKTKETLKETLCDPTDKREFLKIRKIEWENLYNAIEQETFSTIIESIEKRFSKEKLLEILGYQLPDRGTRRHKTLLQFACKKNAHGVVEGILAAAEKAGGKEGAKTIIDQNKSYKNNNYLIHYGVSACDYKLVKILLEYKAHADIQSITGRTPLFIAVRNYDVKMVNLLLKYSANPNIKTYEGKTPLCEAIHLQNVEVTEALLKSGALTTLCQEEEKIPFSIATDKRDFKIIALLIIYSVNFNSSHEGIEQVCNIVKENHPVLMFLDRLNLSLFVAIMSDYFDRIQHLIKSGANINSQDAEGRTPLHYAVKSQNVRLTKLLLAEGALTNFQDITGETSFSIAMLDRNPEIVALLLIYSINLSTSDEKFEQACNIVKEHNPALIPLGIPAFYLFLAVICDCLEMAQYSIEKGANINSQDAEGRTSLHYAVKSQNVRLTKLLLAEGALTNLPDKAGLTPFYIAMLDRNPEIIALLLIYSINLSTPDEKFEQACNIVKEHNPALISLGIPAFYLFLAVTCNCLEVAQYFIEKGANINSQDAEGRTPLHYAVKSQNVRLTKFLLSKRAFTKLPDAAENTPFSIAMLDRNPEIVALLLIYSINLNTSDEKFEQACNIAKEDNPALKYLGKLELLLFLAIIADCFERARYFIEEGARINTQDAEGRTPLHLALMKKQETPIHNYEEIIDFLILQADPNMLNIPDKNGQRPLHLAVLEDNSIAIIKCLMEKGAKINIKDQEELTPLATATRSGNFDTAAYLYSQGGSLTLSSDFEEDYYNYPRMRGV